MDVFEEFSELRPEDADGHKTAVADARGRLVATIGSQSLNGDTNDGGTTASSPNPGASVIPITNGRTRRRLMGGVASAAAVAAAVLGIGLLTPDSAPDAVKTAIGSQSVGAAELLQRTADEQRTRTGDDPTSGPEIVPMADLSGLKADAKPDDVWRWADDLCVDGAPTWAMPPVPPPGTEAQAPAVPEVPDLTQPQCGLVVVASALMVPIPAQRAALLDALATLESIEIVDGAQNCTVSSESTFTTIADLSVKRDGLNVHLTLMESDDNGWLSMASIEGTGSASMSASIGGISVGGASVGGESINDISVAGSVDGPQIVGTAADAPIVVGDDATISGSGVIGSGGVDGSQTVVTVLQADGTMSASGPASGPANGTASGPASGVVNGPVGAPLPGAVGNEAMSIRCSE